MTETNARAVYSISEFEHAYQEEGKIVGFECPSCHHRAMTQALLCPRCGRAGLKGVELSKKGKIKSFTVQNVPSDEFLNDAPYAYALVELDDGAVVSGWLPDVKKDSDLKIGENVHWKQSYKTGLIFERDGTA